jgi:hypothetical protein
MWTFIELPYYWTHIHTQMKVITRMIQHGLHNFQFLPSITIGNWKFSVKLYCKIHENYMLCKTTNTVMHKTKWCDYELDSSPYDESNNIISLCQAHNIHHNEEQGEHKIISSRIIITYYFTSMSNVNNVLHYSHATKWQHIPECDWRKLEEKSQMDLHSSDCGLMACYTSHSYKEIKNFGTISCFHLQGWNVKIETAWSSRASPTYRWHEVKTTRQSKQPSQQIPQNL